MKQILLTSMMVALASPALAAPACEVSNRVATEGYPGANAFNTSNNLVLPAGKAVAYEGQKVNIIGKVLDKNCVPVADAVVELWQHNPYGQMTFASKANLAGADPTFAGAGRTYTNNKGEFSFLTAFPAAADKRAPFVNIKIQKRGLSDFATALFFAGDERNDTDVVFKKLSEKSRKDASLIVSPNEAGELVSTIEFVLPSAAPYRTY